MITNNSMGETMEISTNVESRILPVSLGPDWSDTWRELLIPVITKNHQMTINVAVKTIIAMTRFSLVYGRNMQPSPAFVLTLANSGSYRDAFIPEN